MKSELKLLHICMACTYTEGYNYQENYLSKYHAKIYKTYLITNRYTYLEGKIIKSKEEQYINENGITIYRLNNKYNKSSKSQSSIGMYKGFRLLINKINPDIIFIHNLQFYDIKRIIKYHMHNPNVKIYVDNHADFSNSARNWVSKNIIHKILWRTLAKRLEPHVIKFYGVLPARVDFLVDVYGLPEKKCELLVMGADDDMINELKEDEAELIRLKNHISKNDFLIVTGGKIDSYKKQTLNLMQAIKNINAKKSKKIKLLIFGSVEEGLKVSFNELLDDNIIYIGWIDSKLSYYYFHIANLVVFPGRHSVYWEQVVGMGKPIICKYWDGTTHIDIGGNVRFLKEDSTEEYINAIIEIVENDALYKKMDNIAKCERKKQFLYSEIAKKSVEYNEQ